MNVKDKLEYLIAVIAEFANMHQLTNQQSYVYLNKFKALDFVENFYDVEHTLPFDMVVEDLTSYCKRMGGYLS